MDDDEQNDVPEIAIIDYKHMAGMSTVKYGFSAFPYVGAASKLEVAFRQLGMYGALMERMGMKVKPTLLGVLALHEDKAAIQEKEAIDMIPVNKRAIFQQLLQIGERTDQALQHRKADGQVFALTTADLASPDLNVAPLATHVSESAIPVVPSYWKQMLEPQMQTDRSGKLKKWVTPKMPVHAMDVISAGHASLQDKEFVVSALASAHRVTLMDDPDVKRLESGEVALRELAQWASEARLERRHEAALKVHEAVKDARRRKHSRVTSAPSSSAADQHPEGEANMRDVHEHDE